MENANFPTLDETHITTPNLTIEPIREILRTTDPGITLVGTTTTAEDMVPLITTKIETDLTTETRDETDILITAVIDREIDMMITAVLIEDTKAGTKKDKDPPAVMTPVIIATIHIEAIIIHLGMFLRIETLDKARPKRAVVPGSENGKMSINQPSCSK